MRKRYFVMAMMMLPLMNSITIAAPVSPLKPVPLPMKPAVRQDDASAKEKVSAPVTVPVPAVEVKPLATGKKEEADLLKNIDAVLSGKFDKAADYRPPLPLTQKAWSRQKTETRAGNKVFVWGSGRTFKVILCEGMGTVFKLPDWDTLDQSVLSDSVNFRQKEMNNASMLYVEALSSGADTSLSLIGKSGNIYNFYLASESVYSDNISDQVVYVNAAMPSVKNFFDTESDLKRKENVDTFEKMTKNEKKTWLNELKFNPTKIRHNVEMRGDKKLASVLVFRDARFTYLDYGYDSDSRVWPVAYQVVDRVDQPVNMRKLPDGRYMVVETINPITLRYGEKTVCLKRRK